MGSILTSAPGDASAGTIPEIIFIAAGDFLMGCDQGQDNERPVHRVWVDGFGIGKFPVTNHQYACFVEQTGIEPAPFCSDEKFAGAKRPVVGVTWHEALAYCAWLNQRTGKKFRLPAEAEWEYAVRGGRAAALYPWGDEPPWEKAFLGCDEKTGGPAPVGVNPPNGFGLHDMSEGVHEWCSDYYDYNYYQYSPQRNPPGASAGERRSSRGGSWRHRIKFSRCAARSSLPPSLRYADYGFRVALTIG